MARFKVITETDIYNGPLSRLEVQWSNRDRKMMTKRNRGFLLKLSIQKWEKVLAWAEQHRASIPEGIDYVTCALCIAYPYCQGCPIEYYTGKEDCHGTPFYQAYEAATSKSFRQACKKEIEFLQKVLKAEEKANG